MASDDSFPAVDSYVSSSFSSSSASETSSSSSLPMTESCLGPQLMPSCSDDLPPSTSPQTIFVAAICLFGVVGNALTLIILSRRRLRAGAAAEEDPSVRSAQVDMQALAASNMLLCLVLLPHDFLPRDCLRHSQRWSFHIFYWLYSLAATNALILAGTWLTVTMAVVRYLAIAFPFRVRLLIGRTGSKMKVVAVFAASCLMNVPRLFEHKIETIRCPASLQLTGFDQAAELGHTGSNWSVQAKLSSGLSDGENDMSRMGVEVGEMEFYMQRTGALGSLIDHRIMNTYVWLYFVIGICVPLVLLAIANFGIVRTLRQSTRLRRQFLVRPAHVDANERVTTVLATVVVAYLVLVAPAEILQFVDRQLDIASKPALLVTAVQVTNILQTINFSLNFVVYLILNGQFRRSMINLLCCGCCWRQKDSNQSISLDLPRQRTHLVRSQNKMTAECAF